MVQRMVKRGRVKVDVRPGTFSSERCVSFFAGAQKYSLVVDETMLEGDALLVQIVDEAANDVIIDLPSDTFISGNRVRVPRDLVETVAEQ